MSDSLPILEYTHPATSPRFIVEQTDRGATVTLPARPNWQAVVIAVGAISLLLLVTVLSVGALIDLGETPKELNLFDVSRWVIGPCLFWVLLVLLMRMIFKRQGMQTILMVADGKLTLITPQLLILRREIPLTPKVRCRALWIFATTLNLQPAGRLVIQRPGRFDLYLLRGMSMRELQMIERVLSDAIARNCLKNVSDPELLD